MKLLGRLTNQHLLSGLYFLALLSPVAAINLPLPLVLIQSYRGYLFFFIGFLVFIRVISNKTKTTDNTLFWQRIWQYLCLLLPGVLMVFGLGLLGLDENNRWPLYLTLATCTLHAALNSKKVKDSNYLFAIVHVAFVTGIIFTAFLAIKFSAYYSALLYAVALACSFTAPHMLVRLQILSNATHEQIPEVRTRKQRRKFRNITNILVSNSTWRWFMLSLLLLGPAILTTLSMTNLFPSEYGIIVLLLTLARHLVQPLPVKGPVPVIPNQLIRDWALFGYLFVLSIYLIRISLMQYV